MDSLITAEAPSGLGFASKGSNVVLRKLCLSEIKSEHIDGAIR